LYEGVSGYLGQRVAEPSTNHVELWSHWCSWTDLLVPFPLEAGAAGLGLGGDWLRRWRVEWKFGRETRSCSVFEMSLAPTVAFDPIRGFAWNRAQRHRPELVYMVSTGRFHGAESSTQEARLLLTLDFAGALIDVVSQPLKLVFDTAGGRRSHTPDYLALTPSGVWLIDVRPEHLVKPEDLEKFAASLEVSLAFGWHYIVAARWREHVPAALDAFFSQRRLSSDLLGLRPVLLELASGGQASFGEVAGASGCEPVARAQLLHLLWRRQLGVDLTGPLGDRSILVPASAGAQ
jgi:hypothetical protein